jgi:hypothetical protein
MYLAYVDESEDEQNFVLTALAVVDHQALRLSEAMDRIEATCFGMLPPEERPVLFHCTTIRNPSAHLGRRKVKPKDRQLALLIATWTQLQRDQLISDIYQVIGDCNPFHACLFCVVIDKTAQQSIPDPQANVSSLRYERAFEEIYATFNSYLIRHHQRRVDPARGLAGYTGEKGLFLMDRSAMEPSIKAQSIVYRRLGTQHGVAFNIVETPVFMASEDSRLLQLADFVANGVLRQFRAPPNQDSQFFGSVLRDKLDQENGEIHGLLHITPNYCNCLARHYRYLTPPITPR